jgi:hypothetical protein
MRRSTSCISLKNRLRKENEKNRSKVLDKKKRDMIDSRLSPRGEQEAGMKVASK